MKLLDFHCGVLATTLAIAASLLSGCNLDFGGGDDDSGKAHIRLLNVSPGYNSLDLYLNNGDGDTQKLAGVGYETASDYAAVDSDTYTLKFKRNGVTSTLETLAEQKLTDDSHATYVAYGSSGHFSTLKLAEDASNADSGEAKVQVLNTAETGALDVYLTEDSVSLEDASPTFGDVASGSAASAQTIDSGSYRLRVTGAGDASDLRLDVSNVSFDSTQVAALILTATEGGVLVNALVLPQQGSLSKNENTKARVRGAVGIANGSAVSASVGGVGLLSGATVGVIGSRYAQVEAGSVAVTLSVNGSAVTVPNQTLTAGGDYTLLIWSDANGTQTTWISDANRLPTASGKVKIRLLNGMSGLGAPITLAVDYSPIAEVIALGQASSATELDSGSEYQIDVTQADTGVPLLSRSSVSLQSAAVYTMFMAGGGSLAVSGTLRKDR